MAYHRSDGTMRPGLWTGQVLAAQLCGAHVKMDATPPRQMRRLFDPHRVLEIPLGEGKEGAAAVAIRHNVRGHLQVGPGQAHLKSAAFRLCEHQGKGALCGQDVVAREIRD